MPSCIQKTVQAFRITKAVVTRLMFGLHGLVCIWRVTVTKQQAWYWCLVSSLVLLIAEAVFTLKKKKGGEWKWFCPSVFLYLTSTLPAIWFLELDLLERRIRHKFEMEGDETEKEDDGLSLILEKINFHLPPDDWVKILEQLLLLVLIVGRWLLPKGEITREQLSQLLLVYIGMAADIIELFEAFKEKEVKYNRDLTLIILSLWTASLLQFCFVVSAAKARKSRPSFTKQPSRTSMADAGRCFTCRSEILSIMTTIVLQDGSFLVLRMMLIFRYNVVSYTNIFFTAKNTLVNVLQLYRLVVLYAESFKLIKRQKSDPLFDEVFLIKAGILANKIVKEEELRQGRERKHAQVQTMPSDASVADDTTTSGNDQHFSASNPNLNAVVIENPMNAIEAGEHSQLPAKKSEKSPANTKGKGKKKKSVCKSLAPEIMNITMVYLNPALNTKGLNAVNFLNPNSPRIVRLATRVETDSNSGTMKPIAEGNSTDKENGKGGSPGCRQTEKACEKANLDSPSLPSSKAGSGRTKFKGVVQHVIREGGKTVAIGVTDTHAPLEAATHSQCQPDDEVNVGSSQTESNCVDSKYQVPEILANVIITGGTSVDDLPDQRLEPNNQPDELNVKTLSETLKTSPKKSRWRWKRAKMVGRKKCSDLNQNSTDQIIPSDFEVSVSNFSLTDNI